jgi:DNA-binding response OmpR family regulator
MKDKSAAVLLVGETAARSTTVRKWLSKMGCSFCVVTCFEGARSWLTQMHFDLVLCNYQLVDRTAFPLLDWLEGSPSSLIFCSKRGRESRWLPVIEHGERRLDRQLLGARNLTSALESILAGRARQGSGGIRVLEEELEHVGIE